MKKIMDERSLFTGIIFDGSDVLNNLSRINIMDPRIRKPILKTSHDKKFSFVLRSVSEITFENDNKLEFFTPNNIGIQRNIYKVFLEKYKKH